MPFRPHTKFYTSKHGASYTHTHVPGASLISQQAGPERRRTRPTLIDRTLMLTFDVPAILSDPLPPCHVPSHSLKILKTLYRTPYEPTLSAGVFENRCLLSTGRHGSPDIAPCAWMHDPFVAYMRTVCLYSCVQHQIVVLMAVRVLQGRPLESSSTDRHRFR